MQKEAQSQRREAAEKKWRDRKAEGEKSKRKSDGPAQRDGSPPFIPERDTQRGNSPPIPAMRKAGGGMQPGAAANTDNESEPDIGSDAASGAGLTTTATTASEDDYEVDPRRQSEVWEGLAEV